MNKSNAQNGVMAILIAIAVLVLFVSTSSEAFAHANFRFVPGNGASGEGCVTGPCVSKNHTVFFLIGETFEPAFTDGYHDAELTLTHVISNLRLGNAHRDQTSFAYSQSDFSPAGKVLRVDTYFYPSSKLVNSAGAPSPTGGVKFAIGNGDGNVADNPGASTAGLFCDTATNTGGVLTGNAYNCVPNPGGAFGFIDKREGMFFRPLGELEQSGSGLQYRQNTRQYYTEQGLTLYHIYGSINYFNDTGIGLTKINMWIDGRNIKSLSMAAANGANNRTYDVSGGFGLRNMTTSVYWPDADGGVTENTHPTNLRKAIGQIRDNTWDIWNVLEQLTNALREIPGFASVAIPDHTPRNYTNPGPTSNGQYTFP